MIEILCGILVALVVVGVGITLVIFGILRWLFGEKRG